MGHGMGLPKRGLLAPHRWGTIFKGRGEVGGDEKGNPLPKGWGGVVGVWRERPLPLLLLTGLGGVDGGVVGVGRERPLPLPLHDERPPGLGTKVPKV